MQVRGTMNIRRWQTRFPECTQIDTEFDDRQKLSASWKPLRARRSKRVGPADLIQRYSVFFGAHTAGVMFLIDNVSILYSGDYDFLSFTRSLIGNLEKIAQRFVPSP